MGKLGITKNNKKWSPLPPSHHSTWRERGRVVGWNAKKTGFRRGPEKKMKENGVGWLLNKNFFFLKFFLRCVQICNKTLFFVGKYSVHCKHLSRIVILLGEICQFIKTIFFKRANIWNIRHDYDLRRGGGHSKISLMRGGSCEDS